MTSKVCEIDLARISPNLRFICEQEAIEELCLSIQSHGQQDFIEVYFTGEDFRIVKGERHWRACKKLGLTRIKAIIVEMREES